ncbi:Ribonuclease R [Polystyrenella longa]|uniref:Ribonuclease R n=1 Tax=Polystyrenella longa TaxID=2528007 RepID=A0A518CL60_9PLAN|nr:ribonuclease R [Polystyrenella longa]QDU79956.1 Ribonuclease R [Polystyrenella longa]
MSGKIIFQIKQYLAQSDYKPMTEEMLAKKLDLKKKERSAFGQALDRLIERGEIKVGKKNRLRLKSTVSQEVVGKLKKIASGAGFVMPNELPPDLSPSERRTHDIFVAAEDLIDACSGDEVAAVLLKRTRRGGQRCGRIQRIISRATNTFVGTYKEDNHNGWVQVDGNIFHEWIYVGDPGAKGVEPEDTVVIEMLRFPSHQAEGEAVITKVLGPRGEPGVDLQLVMYEYGLPQEFPDAVLEAASQEAELFDEDVIGDRLDLREELIVTIDPKEARDFDDAISLKKNEAGHWVLGVHIADVAHFVKPGSTLDREATQRGNSVYLPQMVIPMLPEVISNGLASLQADRNRYVKSVFIEFTPDGIPVHTDFANAVINVKRRFAYEDVMPILEDPEKHANDVSAEIRTLLAKMYELSRILRQRRMAHSSLQLEMPEIHLNFNKEGEVAGAEEAHHDESHEVIEEFMLAANVAVAETLSAKGIPFPRRVHPTPSAVKMQNLKVFVEALGFSLPQPEDRNAIRDLLAEVRGTPLESPLSYAVLRSMKQAIYTTTEEGHYALNFENYCHFTSPIRRYPDLIVHRLVDDLIQGKKRKGRQSPEDMEEACKRCSETERRAEKAERALVKLKLLQYVSTQIGMQFDAIITGVQHFGVFCQGIDIPIEGLLPLEGLADHELFDYDEKTLTLTGRRSAQVFRLGDAIRVQVGKVDLEKRELDLELVSHEPSVQLKAPAKGGNPRQKEESRNGNRGPKNPNARGRKGPKGASSGSKKKGGTRSKTPKGRGPSKTRRKRKK